MILLTDEKTYEKESDGREGRPGWGPARGAAGLMKVTGISPSGHRSSPSCYAWLWLWF